MARKLIGSFVLSLALCGCGGATSETPTTAHEEGSQATAEPSSGDASADPATAEGPTDPETTEEVIETSDPLD